MTLSDVHGQMYSSSLAFYYDLHYDPGEITIIWLQSQKEGSSERFSIEIFRK